MSINCYSYYGESSRVASSCIVATTYAVSSSAIFGKSVSYLVADKDSVWAVVSVRVVMASGAEADASARWPPLRTVATFNKTQLLVIT